MKRLITAALWPLFLCLNLGAEPPSKVTIFYDAVSDGGGSGTYEDPLIVGPGMAAVIELWAGIEDPDGGNYGHQFKVAARQGRPCSGLPWFQPYGLSAQIATLQLYKYQPGTVAFDVWVEITDKSATVTSDVKTVYIESLGCDHPGTGSDEEPEPEPESNQPPSNATITLKCADGDLKVTQKQIDEAEKAGDLKVEQVYVGGIGFVNTYSTDLTEAEFLARYPYPASPEPDPEPGGSYRSYLLLRTILGWDTGLALATETEATVNIRFYRHVGEIPVADRFKPQHDLSDPGELIATRTLKVGVRNTVAIMVNGNLGVSGVDLAVIESPVPIRATAIWVSAPKDGQVSYASSPALGQ